jgi:hypothetical protein
MSESSGSPVCDTERTDAPRCRICQHWHRFVEGNTWGWCGRIGPFTAPAATPEHSDGKGDALETQEDFGCVLWKLKQEGA